MIYNIFEIEATGRTHKDAHGRTVEDVTSKQKAKIKAKNGGEALKEFMNNLPLKKQGKVLKCGCVWIGTDQNGMTKYISRRQV